MLDSRGNVVSDPARHIVHTPVLARPPVGQQPATQPPMILRGQGQPPPILQGVATTPVAAQAAPVPAPVPAASQGPLFDTLVGGQSAPTTTVETIEPQHSTGSPLLGALNNQQAQYPSQRQGQYSSQQQEEMQRRQRAGQQPSALFSALSGMV